MTTRKSFRSQAIYVLLVALVVLAAAIAAFWPFPGHAQDLQTAIDSKAREGGGTVTLDRGRRVIVRQGIVLRPGVTLDLNGGEIVAQLNGGNAPGVRIMSSSELRNGTVTVQSRGNPGSQAGAHAAVLIGALYGENPSPDRLSPFEAPTGWAVRDMTLRTDKAMREGSLMLGGAALAIVGGASNGIVERISIPDSPVMAGGVMLDWGTVGNIHSDRVAANAATFRAGRGWSTHPHDIVIRDIRIGRLTRPAVAETGSFGVRLSGTHDISVSNVTIGEVTEAAFYYTAGDLGYEFARNADRQRAHMGNRVDQVRVGRAGAYLVRTDSYADNVGRAAQAGYRPMLEPIAPSDIQVSNVSGGWSGKGAPGFGLRIDHQRGGTYTDVALSGFKRGFYIDEQVSDVALVRPFAEGSGEAAISVEHPYRPPSRITVQDPRASGGTAGARTIIVGTSEAVSVTGAGAAIMRVDRQARNARIR